MRTLCGWMPMLVMAVPVAEAWGCSCSASAYAPACEKLATAEVVFVGTARALEPDPQWPGGGARLYRFQVEAAYKGLPQDAGQVLVSPDNFTTCHREYRLGARYLILAGRLPGTGQLISGACHGSRLADAAVEDVQFLEAYRRGAATNSVRGRVLQWVTEIGRPRQEEDAPVAGALVTLSSGERRFTQRTAHSGEFHFEGIPPGAYRLAAELEPYVAQPAPLAVEVPAAGCVERFPKLTARASLAGVLLTEGGKPAGRMRVELLRRNGSGAWYSTYQFWKRTDEAGRFQFEDLPDGEYLLGYEIWGGGPSRYSEHPTRYYPGVAEQGAATVLTLAPGQALTGLQFQLGKAHTPRPFRVEVRWPDGTAPGPHLLQLFDGEELLKNVEGGWRAGSEGVIDVSGFAERSYELRVRYWVDNLGGPVPYDQQRVALSAPVKVVPGREPLTVKLVLSRRLLAEEDR